MRTEIKRTITTNTQSLKFGYWNEENNEFIAITPNSDAEQIAKILKASPELLDALITTFGDFSDTINSDLLDIWERLDKLEDKINRAAR